MPLRVLSVASEIFPLVKTGGLADVIGALPGALARYDISVRTLIPGYPAVIDALQNAQTVHVEADLFGGRAGLLAARYDDLDLLVLDAPHLYARPGNPYLGPDGLDWRDNAIRFAALSRMAADIGDGVLEGYTPAVVHAHDWQIGLAPAYLHFRGGARPKTVITVHNLSFAGKASPDLLAALDLPPTAYSPEGVEFYGAISLLKAGLLYADRITTVSPTYAEEIRTEAEGMGLDGVLRARAGVLSGILNGIDTKIWDPSSDPLITERYDATTLSRRAANKAALQSRMGIARNPEAPLFGVVSRLTWQKGSDLLVAILPVLRALDAQIVVVGSGESDIEAALRNAAAETPDNVGCFIGYDETLAHEVQAGVDALLVPSRFEPCGLTQLCALRYGAVPVVSRVGGLADTVIDANTAALAAGVATGVQFAPTSVGGLETALRHAVALFHDKPVWRAMQANGMATDVSWSGPARQYAALYQDMTRQGP
jgi:starch synthase